MLALSSTAVAGFNGLTIHSRANCINNESISWDATSYHMLATESLHYTGFKNGHDVTTEWESTWRSAAVHFAEATPGSGWTVAGIHWVIENNLPRCLGTETVTDCSLYDGWWDRDKPQVSKYVAYVKKEPFDASKGPLPGSGVKVLPLNNVNIPDSFKKKILSNMAQQKLKGYYFLQSDYPKQVLIKNKNSLFEVDNSMNPFDTHLKKNLSATKLAFSYKGISNISSKNFIGYAVLGMWKNNGWTGIKAFFNDKDFGTCTYSLNNMALTKGAVQIPIEIVRHDINHKITVIDIKGNEGDGFIYTISWFDKIFSHDFECVNMKYDLTITEKMIGFAQEIDTNEEIERR